MVVVGRIVDAGVEEPAIAELANVNRGGPVFIPLRHTILNSTVGAVVNRLNPNMHVDCFVTESADIVQFNRDQAFAGLVGVCSISG